jgi:hypothetical protein
VAEGWDCVIFQLEGQDEPLVARLPRRAVAAAGMAEEIRWLPRVAPGLPLLVPVPLRAGAPGQGFPFPWSVARWIEGETADRAPLTDLLEAARTITAHAAQRGVRLELPVDHVVTEKIEANAPHATLAVDDPAIGDRMGVDIGPRTVQAYTGLVEGAQTVIWNGPMGVFETKPFDEGTNAVARAVAKVDGTTIIGGGDSVSAVSKAGVADRITHISTGGGASLEFLGGRTLPGVAALANR